MLARSSKSSPNLPRWFRVSGLSSPNAVSKKTVVSKSTEQGLTLIECLVAIVVIAITVVAVTPPVFLATATRIQSRRAEQANEIAQQEIDRVRGIVERGGYKMGALPATIGSATNLKDVAKPDKSLSSYLSSPGICQGKTPYPAPETPAPAASLTPVDVDGDCKPEYAMQVFRTDGCVPSGVTDPTGAAVPPYAFQLGVRVYAYIDRENLPDLKTERANLSLTVGRRDSTTNSRKPLQTIYTRLSRSNSSQALECADK